MDENQKKLFLIDAYALIYRSYFAFIRNPRFNSKGVNTSAALGFANTLVQLLEAEKPEYIGVVFDLPKPTFRHLMYPEYKANRQEMPEDLRNSVPYIRKLVEALRIPIIEMECFEADDIIGTLAKKASVEGFTTFMMTPDKDYAQLVTDRIFMYKPGKGGNDNEIWGVEEVRQNFEIDHPGQVIDILGLMGDASDNIPGCPGVGPKNAQKLISDFGSIDGIYQNLDKLKGKQKDRVAKVYDELGRAIGDKLFTRSDMMKGLADAHEEVKRMTEPSIPVTGDAMSLAKACNVKTVKGKVTREGAAKIWKILGKALGDRTNTEHLRRDG